MIKIIHQTTSNGLIPINLIEYVSSLTFYHPTWKYMLWDDDMSLRFIQSEYNFIFKNYIKSKGIQKADILRYCVLHKFGGLYVDTDVFFYKNIETIIHDEKGIILAPSIPTLPYFKNTATNYIIYCGEKNNNFWIILLHEINRRLSIYDNWIYKISILNSIIIPYTTGRVVLTKFIDDNYFTIFNSNLIINKFSPLYKFNTDYVYCVHIGGTARIEGKQWGNKIEYYFMLCEFKMREILHIKQNSYQTPLCSIIICLIILYIVNTNIWKFLYS